MPPVLDMDYEKRVQTAMREIVEAGLAESAHDVSDGGLAVCLAEASFGGIGAAIDLDSALRPEFLLFHEGPSRIVISTPEPEKVRQIAAKLEVEAPRIGATKDSTLRIAGGTAVFVDCELKRLRDRWERALEDLLHSA
jgi:phosphoribosylformylglycinamidine synthase